MSEMLTPHKPQTYISCASAEILSVLQQECEQKAGRIEVLYARKLLHGGMELRYVVNHAREGQFTVVQCAVDAQAPSMARHYPLLGWYEREIHDVYGINFTNHPEPVPLLNPLRGLEVQSLTQDKDVQLFPFGPVRADVVESAAFTFYYAGEAILHYQPHLFFKHRGMEQRFEGLSPAQGAVLAERVSGIGSLAHALAFSQAVEAASGCVVPLRAQQWRTVLAELERIYNHLYYLGHLADTTTLKVAQAEGKLLAEHAKQMNGRLTGSRFLRSLLRPGGLRRDLELHDGMLLSLERLRSQAAWYVEFLLASNSFRDRLLTTGHLDQRTAYDQGATGPIARASGIDRDLRRDHPYAGYDKLNIPVPVREHGDADARLRVRIEELSTSFDMVVAMLRQLEPGEFYTPCAPCAGGEGLGWAESPRGALFYAVHFSESGCLERVKIKSPSFSNWRVFPFTVHETNMMDYAINEASFGLSIAGCDR